ncbi:DNA double-strand break repair nuclease NurA [Candidatus Dependentiae bacterium]
MLDRCKLIKEINSVSDKLFVDFTYEKNIARQVWEKISKDPTFKYKVKSVDTHWIIPEWQGNLGDVFEIEQNLDKYIVLSVDGSQIYPDRHSGTACHLINVGYVGLTYGLPFNGEPLNGELCDGGLGKRVYLNSEPHVFADLDASSLGDLPDSPTEIVNCRRQEFELVAGYDLCKDYKKKFLQTQAPMVFLFDGSIIFWHLESKATEVKQHFLASYLQMMHQFYQEKILMAGYISLTKSKEIVNLIRVALCDFVIENCQEYKIVDRVVDAMIASFYLQPFERSTIFKNNSKITNYYPEHLKPHFFYMHIGNEIVRIEIPAWVAQDQEKIEIISRVIADQAIKGRGYPVAIAEAHEQAVVKGADREFFYHLINKIGLEHNRTLRISQKSRKKLGMGI